MSGLDGQGWPADMTARVAANVLKTTAETSLEILEVVAWLESLCPTCNTPRTYYDGWHCPTCQTIEILKTSLNKARERIKYQDPKILGMQEIDDALNSIANMPY